MKAILFISLIAACMFSGCAKPEPSDISPDVLSISIVEVNPDIFDTGSKLNLSDYGDLDWMGFSREGIHSQKKGANWIHDVEAKAPGDLKASGGGGGGIFWGFDDGDQNPASFTNGSYGFSDGDPGSNNDLKKSSIQIDTLTFTAA